MKNLTKLVINQEKVLKKEELKKLKGGNFHGQCWAYHYSSPTVDLTYLSGWDQQECIDLCECMFVGCGATGWCQCDPM